MFQTTTKPNQVIIFDTTLRDGEQSPGCSMTTEEKIRMAIQLEKLGVNVMEAGFPASSAGDWDAVNKIAKTVKDVTVAGLCRAVENDIRVTAAAISPAINKRIHTFISTSPIHMAKKLQKTPDQVLEMVTDSVSFARMFVDDVEWSAEDATRTDIDFLCRTVEAAIGAGATTINLPDTVGYADPDDYAEMFIQVMNRVPNADKAIFSAHCHNDRGMAVANSLYAVRAGVRQVELTVNGIGERAGNAALEAVVMAMASRPDKYPVFTTINTPLLVPTSHVLSEIIGQCPQPNSPIVGANAFAHESGIHQDGVLKDRTTYEIITPEAVGAVSENIIGKHSGQAAVRNKLEKLGFTSPDKATLAKVFNDVKDHADKHKIVPDAQIVAIATQHKISRLVA